MKRRILLPTVGLLLALALLAGYAVYEAKRGAAYDADTPLHISLNNIEIEEIYYRPQLHGSVAVDRQTGVMYWISEAGEATLLVDAKGRPRRWGAQ